MLHSGHWKLAMNIGWQCIDVWEGIRVVIDKWKVNIPITQALSNQP
jgi:hypothetical protein